MSDPKTIGQIVGWDTSRAGMERLLDGLRGENGSGQESAATGGPE